MKYRIEFLDKKLSGPLTSDEVINLIQEKNLSGEEKIQEYPIGSWGLLKIHHLYEKKEATFIRKLSDFGLGNEASKTPDIPKAPIEKKIEKNFPSEFPVKSEADVEVDTTDEEEEPFHDKTVVKNINQIMSDFDPDTTRIRPDTLKHLEKLRKEKEQKEKEEKLRKEREVKEEKKIDYNHESTQVINLKDLKNDLKKELKISEKELAEEKKLLDQEKKDLALRKKTNKKEDHEEDSKEDHKKKKRKKLIIYIALILVVWVVLFPEEEKVVKDKIVVLRPVIQFPIEYEQANKKKSDELTRKGIQLLSDHTYLNLLKASKVLTKAAERNIDNKLALKKLFLANAMLLDESQSIFKEANTTFKIYKIIPPDKIDPNNQNLIGLYSDVDKVKGMVYFYKNIGKYGAALNILDRFSKTKTKPSLEVYALWLDLLMKEGMIDRARKKYEVLAKAVNANYTKDYLSPQIFVSLINYNEIQSDLVKANDWANKGIKLFPESVSLLLEKVNLYLGSRDTKGMAKYLTMIEKLGAENKPAYYAKYLEYSGLYFILKTDYKKAIPLFKQALAINESDELRAKLASLKPTGNDSEADKLINESKAIHEYFKAREKLRVNKWRKALAHVTKAVDLNPKYIPALILFSKLQMRSGFYEQAISDLQDAMKENSQSHELYFALLEVYIKLYKFNEATALVNLISSSPAKHDSRFPSILSRLYAQKGDRLSAANWLVNALNRNPLNDKDYYELAQLYMKSNKFNEARRFLTKSIELNPFNIKYRAAYAQYLYDSNGTDVAIGYLLDLMKDENFKNDKAYLIGEIGIYYYRAGKIEDFKETRAMLEKMDFPKKNLYEYVIRTSLIDGEFEETIKNGRALLEIEPGDIETRMLLGKTYFNKERYELALREFKEVKKMMKSYPKLKYFIAKAYLSIGNRKKAYEMAQEEVNTNPHLEDGYILMADIETGDEDWLNAERNYRRALQIKGDSLQAIMGLAYISYKKNKQDSALALYRKAKNIDPTNAEVHRMLGQIYRLLGQGQKAIQNYKIYLKSVPHSKYKQDIESYIKIME